jgi:pteridine reductase
VELRGRVALVTGGARRVGRALAIALAERGAHVAIHYGHSQKEARETLDRITSLGVRCETFQADLTAPEAPASLIDRVVQHFGELHVLVNSAAVMERTPFGQVETRAWDEIIALNLRAPFFLTQAAAPALRQARGAVVNIGDLSAFETWPGYIPHGVTKSGIVYITRALANVLAPHIRVNAIAPGTVLLPEGWSETEDARLRETTPLKRSGSPQDVASAMLFLLDSDYITGETIVVDGGRRVRR